MRSARGSDFFPATAIQGMLSAIGLMLLIKQLYVMLGDLKTKGKIFDLILGLPDLFSSLKNAGVGTLYAVELVWLAFL